MVAERPTEPFVLSRHAERVLLERGVAIEWVAAVIAMPTKTEADSEDAELRHALGPVAAREGRVLRVVYNPGKKPPVVVTAYFDRRMKGRL